MRLTDTAGIRKTRGVIETIGVQRSRKQLALSAIVLHVLDSSRAFSKGEEDLAELYAGKPAILVENKVDLPRRLKLPSEFACQSPVRISALTGEGIDQIKQRVEGIVWSGTVGATASDVTVNERQTEALRRSLNSLTSALDEADRGTTLEVISQQLRVALDAIGEIVGKTATDDILSRVFSTFCIGK